MCSSGFNVSSQLKGSAHTAKNVHLGMNQPQHVSSVEISGFKNRCNVLKGAQSSHRAGRFPVRVGDNETLAINTTFLAEMNILCSLVSEVSRAIVVLKEADTRETPEAIKHRPHRRPAEVSGRQYVWQRCGSNGGAR